MNTFTVFTTRPDTLFGATYAVLAPEHPFVEKITTAEQKQQLKHILKKLKRKSDLERTDLRKKKQVYLLVLMRLILLMVKKCRFGLPIMS